MKIDFYWDELSLIRAYTTEPFLALDGLCLYKNQEQIDYNLGHFDEKGFEILITENYDFHSNYHIEYHGQNYEIVERLVVLNRSFDDNCVPDVTTLGSFYYYDHCLFRVWVPFAEKVRLMINGESHLMDLKDRYVFEIDLKGDYDSCAYYYEIKRHNQIYQAIDPFAYSSNANGELSYVINLDRVNHHRVSPELQLDDYQDCIIYETSVRDFSVDSHFENPATFKAMGKEGLTLDNQAIGFDYLKSLGVSHIQLMPIFDFVTVDENDKFAQYNWGYDPYQYNVIDGSYVLNPNDPYTRLNEFIDLVNSLHANNLHINLDVVFNHVYKYYNFPLNTLCPYYFYRYKNNLELSDGSFCGNEIRSESKFMHDYILLMVKRYLEIFDIDGLRFDLMSLIDNRTMNDIVSLCKSYKSDFILYGEGWVLPTVLKAEEQSNFDNYQKLNEVAFFNSEFRDSVKNYALGDLNQASNIKKLFGDQTLLKGNQSINYVECHDNFTFYDYMTKMCPQDDYDVKLAKAKLALSLILLAKGIPFIHSGQEFLRTKKGHDNSYNLPDSINRIDWNLKNQNLELVNYLKELIKFRSEHPNFKRGVNSTISLEDYYEVLVYKIDDYIVLFNPCPFYHLYNIEGRYQLIFNENGKVSMMVEDCVGVKEFSIAIAKRVD